MTSAYEVMTEGHFLSEKVIQNGKRRKTWRYFYPRRHIMHAVYEYHGKQYTVKLQWSWWLFPNYEVWWERKPDEIVAVEEQMVAPRPNPVLLGVALATT